MDSSQKCIEVIAQICEKNGESKPGKKKVQKLMYLIERSGVELNLNYSIHFFGPYSSRLDDMLHTFECQDIIEINTDKPTHFISIRNRPENTVQFPEADQKKINHVLKMFAGKTASELEAITTVDYAAAHLVPDGSGEDCIIEQVIKIKGEKFTPDVLEKGYRMLCQEGYIS